MNRKTTYTGLVACALLAVSSTQASGFIRPLVSFVAPTSEGYSNAAGYGVAVGLTPDQGKHHELSLEVNYSAWKEDDSFAPYRVTAEEKYMPILLNYRYYFGSATRTTRFFIGPSIGVTQARYSASFSGPYFNESDSATDWVPTISAAAGLEFSIGDKISLQLGYRFLAVDEAEIEMFGRTSKLDSFTANIAFLGLGSRF